uniref:Nodule-specific cysteine-rich peptide 165 n=1 Tax=Medicago truncatula TaxID=3880 RepID=A7KHA6_MEDTR|nr:nodule-specific cysteine-rich peptide 165 [Medicago truncatula]
MARTLKFVYSMILFLSLFLVANGLKIFCIDVADCPKDLYPLLYKCIYNKCIVFTRIPFPFDWI